MLLSGHFRLLAAGALSVATAVPATLFASDALLAAPFSADALPASLPIDITLIQAADDDAVTGGTGATGADATKAGVARIDIADAELECMAKVVVHEAGNQPRAGQLAVAQLIVNRMESGRFADTICGVVNQPGQFFQTASYHPRRDTPVWAVAVAVSREALAGQTADIAPGAMFFRAAYAPQSGFFRGRTRVATLGDHVFYR